MIKVIKIRGLEAGVTEANQAKIENKQKLNSEECSLSKEYDQAKSCNGKFSVFFRDTSPV